MHLRLGDAGGVRGRCRAGALAATFFRPERATWQNPAQGGGFAYGQLSHSLALMLWLTGLDAPDGRGAHLYARRRRPLRCGPVVFDEGAVGSLHGAAAMPEGSRALLRIIVTGSEGMVSAEFDRDRCEIRRFDGKDRTLPIEPGQWAVDGRRPTDTLVDLALGRGDNRSPGEIGAATVSLIEAMLRSSAKGAAVDVYSPKESVTMETETLAFMLKMRPGKAEEYEKRHDELWPEMKALLLGAGILHYEIYLEKETNFLFGHIVRRKDHTMDDDRRRSGQQALAGVHARRAGAGRRQGFSTAVEAGVPAGGRHIACPRLLSSHFIAAPGPSAGRAARWRDRGRGTGARSPRPCRA